MVNSLLTILTGLLTSYSRGIPMEHCHSETAVWAIQLITFGIGIFIGYSIWGGDDG